MNKRIPIAAALALTLGLAGCSQQPTHQDVGQVIGAIAGGMIGSKIGDGSTAGTVAGAIIGGFIGGQIGRDMEAQDRRHAHDALEHNRDHQPAHWRNPNTGTAYRVTPERTYYREELPCREYSTQAVIGGREEVVYGTACRQPDGSWQAAN